MTTGVYECRCGHSYRMKEADGSEMRCPACGQMVAFPSKEMGPAKKEAFEKLVEAIFELMGEGFDGICPFSGAR